MSPRTILICQSKTCRKQGSAAVLAAFQAQSLPKAEIVGSGCLGHCGSGPTVLVLPEQVLYRRVRRNEVAAIVQSLAGQFEQRHLREG